MTHPDLLVDTSTSDDAGVYRIAPDRALVQTVDFFTPVVNEPAAWGRITAANALSDIYAMGATPLTALQLVGWPRDELSFEILAEVMAGGADVMAEAGCVIVGGHSIDDREPKYGFAVTGEVHPEQVVRNVGALPGDRLVITKPIGTGIIATAIKAGKCPEAVSEAAIASMASLNAAAAGAMKAIGVNAATDVTGFGLVGHLHEIAQASGHAAQLEVDRIPILDGVRDLLAAGFFPGGSERNLAAAREFTDAGSMVEMFQIVADAQTSGGLLIALPDHATDRFLAELEERSVDAWEIGRMTEGTAGHVDLV